MTPRPRVIRRTTTAPLRAPGPEDYELDSRSLTASARQEPQSDTFFATYVEFLDVSASLLEARGTTASQQILQLGQGIETVANVYQAAVDGAPLDPVLESLGEMATNSLMAMAMLGGDPRVWLEAAQESIYQQLMGDAA